MRKKIVALLMALTMVPALAACGSSNGTGNNTAGAPAESQTGETTAAQETEVRSQGETKAETNAESKAEAPALSGTMKVVATSENYVTLFDKFTEDTGVKVELLSICLLYTSYAGGVKEHCHDRPYDNSQSGVC